MVCEVLSEAAVQNLERRARWAKRRASVTVVAIVELDLDLSRVKRKIVHPKHGLGWSKERADRAEQMYRNFLVLVGLRSAKRLVPFDDIDEMWHFHILDTVKYRDDCEMIFGHYLDHHPYFGMEGPEDEAALEAATEDTRRLYEVYFGPIPGTARSQSCETIACGV